MHGLVSRENGIISVYIKRNHEISMFLNYIDWLFDELIV